MMKRVQQLLLWVGVGFTLGYGVCSWIAILTTTAPDFSVYYGAARLLWMGEPLSGDTGLFTGFGYPPTTLVLFFPFLLLSYSQAQGVWVTLSFLLVPLCVYLSLKLVYSDKQVSLVVFALFCSLFFWSFPTRFTLGMGQINLLTIFFLLGSMRFLKRKQSLLGGICLFFVVVAKPHFLLLFPGLLLLQYYKTLLLSSVLYIGTTVLVGSVFGMNYFMSYLFFELPQLSKFIGREIYYNQSLGAFVSRVFPLPTAAVVTAIVSIIFYFGMLFVTKKLRVSLMSFIVLFLPIFLFIEPLAWQHHFVFLLPVFLFFWGRRHATRRDRILLIVSYILISINLNAVFFRPTEWKFFWGILLSHAFWGNMLLVFLAKRFILKP